MSKKGGPDPADTIQAQKDANRITQLGPNGNIRYGSVDASGNFVPTAGGDAVQMQQTPFQQQIGQIGQNLALSLAGQLPTTLAPARSADQIRAAMNQGGALGSDLKSGLNTLQDPSALRQGLSDFRPVNTDYAAQSKQAQDATYQQGLALLQPQLDLQRQRTQQSLADQGLPVTSEAYNGEMNRLDQSQGNQQNQLALASILAGNNEQNTLFGQDATASNLAAQQRAQQYTENQGVMNAGLQQRNQLFNENNTQFNDVVNKQMQLGNLEGQRQTQQFNQLAAILGIPQTPQPMNVPGVDAAGITANAAANNNAAVSGLSTAAGLGTMGIMGAMSAGAGMTGAATAGASMLPLLLASDIRLKEKIVRAGKVNGHNVYEFSYKGRPERYKGVLAQEVEKDHPEAIVMRNGYRYVNYAALGIPMEVRHGN